MIYENVKLTKDDENSEILTEQTLDMLHVAVNPMDEYWISTENTKSKNQKKNNKSNINDNKKPKTVQNACSCCGKESTHRCSVCKIPYCSKLCQAAHWNIHQHSCGSEDLEEVKNDDQHESKEAQACRKLCKQHQLTPAFTKEQLIKLKREELKIILLHWIIPLAKNKYTKKADIIQKILVHANNVNAPVEEQQEAKENEYEDSESEEHSETEDDSASDENSASDEDSESEENSETEEEEDADIGLKLNNISTETKDEWETVATGLDAIVQYLNGENEVTQLWKSLQISEHDVSNYLGKKWARREAKSYLKRLHYELKDFKLKIHKQNKYVMQWENVKSKWTSSKRYIVLLSFKELVLFKQALLKLDDSNIKIQSDEMHWYKWLKANGNGKVSAYLSSKYKKTQKKLEERRVERLTRRRRYYYGNINVGRMKKDNLIYFAQEHGIIIPPKTTKKTAIRDLVIKELKFRKMKDWEKNQICWNANCNKKAIQDAHTVKWHVIAAQIAERNIGMQNIKQSVIFCIINLLERKLKMRYIYFLHWRKLNKHAKQRMSLNHYSI